MWDGGGDDGVTRIGVDDVIGGVVTKDDVCYCW